MANKENSNAQEEKKSTLDNWADRLENMNRNIEKRGGAKQVANDINNKAAAKAKKAGSAVKNAAGKAKGAVSNAPRKAVQAVKNAPENFRNAKKSAKEAFQNGKEKLGQKYNDFANNFDKKFDEGMTNLENKVDDFKDNVADKAQQAKDKLGEFKDGVKDTANKIRNSTPEQRKEAVKNAFQKGKEKAGEAINAAKDAVKDGVTGAVEGVKKGAGAIKKGAVDAFNNGKDKVINAAQNVGKAAKNVADAVRHPVQTTKKLGKKAGTAVKNKVKEKIDEVKEKIERVKKLIKAAIKVAKAFVKLMINLLKIAIHAWPVTIILFLIFLFGFGVANIGLQQEALKTDFLAYYESGCEADNTSQVCQENKPIEDMTDAEFTSQLLKYSAEDQYAAEVLILKNKLDEEYQNAVSDAGNLASTFYEDKEQLPDFSNVTLYTTDDVNYYTGSYGTLFSYRDSSSPTDAEIFKNSKKYDFSKYTEEDYFGKVLINDESLDELLDEVSAAKIISAFIVSNGDSYPVKFSEGDDKYSISYFQNFLNGLEAASGTFFPITSSIEVVPYTLKIDVEKVSCQVSGKIEISSGEIIIDRPYNVDNTTSTQYETTYKCTSTKVEPYKLTLDVEILYLTIHKVDTAPATSAILMLARYKDLFQSEKKYKYFQDEHIKNFGYESVIEEIFTDGKDMYKATGNEEESIQSVREYCKSEHGGHHFEDYRDFVLCLFDSAMEISGFYEEVSTETFYRWSPAYYYECDHYSEPQLESTCPHLLTESDISSLPSDKEWGKNREAGQLCGAPIAKKDNSWLDSFKRGAKWLIDSTVGAIFHFNVPETWIKQHSLYTYVKLQDENGNPLNEDHSKEDIHYSIEEYKRRVEEYRNFTQNPNNSGSGSGSNPRPGGGSSSGPTAGGENAGERYILEE